MEYPEHEKFSHDGLTKALGYALDTAMLGSDPDYWYTGVLSAIAAVNAAQASRQLMPGYSSVAAHVEHVRVSLNYVRRTLEGEEVKVDWPGSWANQRVSEAEWDALREQLKLEYEATSKLIQSKPFWREEGLTNMLYNISHAAYHAGAIRQILKGVQS